MIGTDRWDRRSVVKAAGAGALAALGGPLASLRSEETTGPRGSIKQSVCRWCYGEIPLEKLAAEAKRIGYGSIELVTPAEYPTVKAAGLTCAMLSGACRIEDCFNRKENHDQLVKALREHIEFAAANGLPNVICFSGNRRGMSDEEGLANCAVGLKRIVGFAEQKKVTICMELLNSKVNHKDYMCDHTAWGVELAKQVGSPRFKLLYDIYHMQIMEGDVIRTIQENKDYIGHYHTGGNPGRHEIDETQELYYPAIVKAIIATGYDGFLAQEFIPARDPLASLAQGFRICDVGTQRARSREHARMMGNYDMAAERKFRFSLSTVLLFTVIVALAVSHWVQMRKVRQAQARLKDALSEVASVRKQFGHLEIGDPKMIYVGWIESRSNSLRVQIPPGHRFLMHVTEMGFPPAGWPENPEPTTSMSMNSWSEGADVFLQWRFLREGKNRRFIVKTDSEQLFDYTMENWAEGPLPNSSARIVHSREPQKSFQPHETIPLMLFKNESTGRGVMLWMEPLRKRYPAHP